MPDRSTRARDPDPDPEERKERKIRIGVLLVVLLYGVGADHTLHHLAGTILGTMTRNNPP